MAYAHCLGIFSQRKKQCISVLKPHFQNTLECVPTIILKLNIFCKPYLSAALTEYSAPVEHPGRLKLNTLVAVG